MVYLPTRGKLQHPATPPPDGRGCPPTRRGSLITGLTPPSQPPATALTPGCRGPSHGIPPHHGVGVRRAGGGPCAHEAQRRPGGGVEAGGRPRTHIVGVDATSDGHGQVELAVTAVVAEDVRDRPAEPAEHAEAGEQPVPRHRRPTRPPAGSLSVCVRACVPARFRLTRTALPPPSPPPHRPASGAESGPRRRRAVPPSAGLTPAATEDRHPRAPLQIPTTQPRLLSFLFLFFFLLFFFFTPPPHKPAAPAAEARSGGSAALGGPVSSGASRWGPTGGVRWLIGVFLGCIF